MKTTKRSLRNSVTALLLCFIMLVGTTFAWFTDEVTSANNIIKAGTLDLGMQWSTDNSNWKDAEGALAEPVFDYDLWEPGYTEVRYIKVTNDGSLAFKYQMYFNPTGVVGKLAEVIDVSYDIVTGNANFAAPASKYDMGSLRTVGTLNDLIASNEAVAGGVLLPEGETAEGYYTKEIVVCIAFHMQETAGNEYQGTSIGDAFGINLYATQFDYENDSFGNSYDDDAAWPYRGNGYQAIQSISNKIDAATGTLSQSVTVGDTNGQVYADVPNGIKLADGANTLTLTVEGITNSNSGISATHRSQVVRSVDVHIDGVAEDNTVAMIISLKALLPSGLNSNNVNLYHVENGQTIEMTLVSDPVNHNEFSYDPATGDVVMALASFSEIATFAETDAVWDGESTDGTWFDRTTYESTSTFTIANAEQFVYFRDLVDEEGYTFEGKTVKLGNDNIYLGGHNFDPIGWGYDYDGFTPEGKTFNGTFDGNNKTIFGLYQNGWEANDKGNKYDYSMAGGGLFASVVDATIKNLTISGADIVMECIDMGVVAGYAQGKCTFDNISIINCTIQNYNRYTGGVVGEVSPKYNADGTPVQYTVDGETINGGYHLFNEIKVDSTTTVSSLWGSFDTSLGGILGGKWDKNGAETKVKMTNCDVACTIDAFNDVTSAYQWYAYRRAGMLIGNTEQSENHKALANFLTCDKVYVYYGEWNNYHYCEFENQSGSDNASWQNNYPWVRVESGLSCNAYSNPRYGHPIINGEAIVDSIHSHQTGDECMVSLPFAQLYGGGQGVYGATEHTGVGVGAYTVTYINYDETLKVEFVGDNSEAHTLWNPEEYVYGESKTVAWVDGNGKEVSSIEKGNVKNYIVYPRFAGEFVIRFFDAEGNVVYFETFKEKQQHTLDTAAINTALANIQNRVDASGKVIVVSWDRSNLTSISKSEATKDIIVKAVYTLSTSSITLTPVEENGVVVSYKVTDANDTVENVLISIPPYVGTVPVETMSDDAFAGFDNLHSVVIPTTITYIGTNALASTWNNSNFWDTDKGEEMVIYYAGSYKQWQDNMKFGDGWSNGVSGTTRIFFLNGTDTVDLNEGYFQFVVDSSTLLGGVKSGHFEYVNEVPSSFVDEYYVNCTCKVDGCKGNLRPDAKYWVAHKNNSN